MTKQTDVATHRISEDITAVARKTLAYFCLFSSHSRFVRILVTTNVDVNVKQGDTETNVIAWLL